MSNNRPTDLAGWLAYIEQQHPQTIALGLERVERVRAAMGLVPAVPVITVAGTNGKGSTCAMLEAILAAAGYRVGLYTSPHLLRYNERVRIAGREADDAALAAAFARVEAARIETGGDTRLTYFEFGTLAAVDLFLRSAVDVLVLEVGMGGRLDAVNAFDPDCAIVTSVDLDHMDYLGATREAIGYEKAGIFRAGKPAVLADPAPPASVLAHAQAIGARLLRIGREFGYDSGGRPVVVLGAGGQEIRLAFPGAARRDPAAKREWGAGSIGDAARTLARLLGRHAPGIGQGRVARAFSGAAGASRAGARRGTQPAGSCSARAKSFRSRLLLRHIGGIRHAAR